MNGLPTIHILGAGALGSFWAAKLAPHNNIVLLVKPNSNTAHRNFQLVEKNHTTPFSLPCETSHSLGEPSLNTLLVFTKSYDTLNAIEQISHRLHASTKIVLFQNGMGSQQAVVERLPKHSVYAASTTEGANRTSHETVIYAGKGETWLGQISSNRPNIALQQQNIESLMTLLQTSTLTINHEKDIWQRLWVKLAINCAINPFTALLNCSNGEIAHHGYFRKNITPLCEELSEAMRLNNVVMSPKDIHITVNDVIKKTSQNISSMLQDVRSEKQTEINYMNGYINNVAQTHNRSFPVNLQLLERVNRQFN